MTREQLEQAVKDAEARIEALKANRKGLMEQVAELQRQIREITPDTWRPSDGAVFKAAEKDLRRALWELRHVDKPAIRVAPTTYVPSEPRPWREGRITVNGAKRGRVDGFDWYASFPRGGWDVHPDDAHKLKCLGVSANPDGWSR